MVIYKFKSTERKGDQQWQIVHNCIYQWRNLNNAKYPFYDEIMNMKTRRWNDNQRCYVSTSYHFNLNKW